MTSAPDIQEAAADPALTRIPSSGEVQTAAREFLDSTGLLEKFAPLRTLNEQFRTESPQFQDLFPIIEADEDLLKRFLKFANDNWFDSGVKVDSPYAAYTRFGTEGFYKLALAAFLAHGIGELGTRFKIWPHLETAARTAQSLAINLAPDYVEDVFSAGLLHDAVVPPMERALPDYLYFLECAMGMDPVVTRLENNCHQFDHAQAAGELAAALAFESHIVEAVAHHHKDKLSAVADPKARIVLSLLLLAKKTLHNKTAQKRTPFETPAEKNLLAEISLALGHPAAKVQTTIAKILAEQREREEA